MRRNLAAGVLKKSSGAAAGRTLKYTVDFLDQQHLQLVMTLQEVIIQNLGRPDLLQPFSAEFVRQHMGPRGIVLGAFVRNRLVAFRNVYYPGSMDKQWNLGLDLGLAEEDLSKVANLQMVCVHPGFRGYGLAYKMNQVALGLLLEKGTHCNVCATVSPYNIWNLRILIASGFCICKLKSKYGGKLRYIVYQNLRRPFNFDARSAVSIRLNDLHTQEKLFDAGFCATELNSREKICSDHPMDGCDLIFKAPVAQKHAPFDLLAATWRSGAGGEQHAIC